MCYRAQLSLLQVLSLINFHTFLVSNNMLSLQTPNEITNPIGCVSSVIMDYLPTMTEWPSVSMDCHDDWRDDLQTGDIVDVISKR